MILLIVNVEDLEIMRDDVIDVLARWPFSKGMMGKKQMMEWAAIAERLSRSEHKSLLKILRHNLRVLL